MILLARSKPDLIEVVLDELITSLSSSALHVSSPSTSSSIPLGWLDFFVVFIDMSVERYPYFFFSIIFFFKIDK